MTKEEIINFLDKNCTTEQQRFLVEFMKTYLNAGNKIKQTTILILEAKLGDANE